MVDGLMHAWQTAAVHASQRLDRPNMEFNISARRLLGEWDISVSYHLRLIQAPAMQCGLTAGELLGQRTLISNNRQSSRLEQPDDIEISPVPHESGRIEADGTVRCEADCLSLNLDLNNSAWLTPLPGF